MTKQQASICVFCLSVIAFCAAMLILVPLFMSFGIPTASNWVTVERNGVAIDCVYTPWTPALECDWEGVTNAQARP